MDADSVERACVADGVTDLFGEAKDHLRHGRYDQAALVLRSILEKDKDHFQALVLLGLMPGPPAADAEGLLKRILAIVPAYFPVLQRLGKLYQERDVHDSAVILFARAEVLIPESAAVKNGLGVSLHWLGRLTAALAVFEEALAIDPELPTTQANVGLVCCDLGKWTAATAAFRRSLALSPGEAETWRHLASALHVVADLAGAETACRHAIACQREFVDAYVQLARTLDRARRREEAARIWIAAARMRNLEVKPCRQGPPVARVLLLAGTDTGNVPTTFLFHHDRYETIGVYLLPPSEPDAALAALVKRLPEFDLAFNVIAEADGGQPYLRRAGRLFQHCEKPLLNAPERIPFTRRDRIPHLLVDITGLVVPCTTRLSREDLARIGHRRRSFRRPKLVRPTGAHGGKDLWRIDRPEQIERYLSQVPFEQHYYTEYHDYKSNDGYYRKYRFIFVDRQVFPYHLAIGADWMLHYFRAGMAGTPWKQQEEETFLADYRSVFPQQLSDAVTEIARRMDLDYAGLDCSVTSDNRLLVFEANAGMLVHLYDSMREFPYKHRYVPRIFDAFDQMIARRLGRR
jgi:glutathione synthase/RimK-type ligase-like ATP-grasp enzyme